MNKSKILIVDDKIENLKALEALLKFDDAQMVVTQKPIQALELLTEHDFCLALLDVQMPEMSGFELARLIRGVRKFKHIPIIFVTAHSVNEQLTFEGYDAGAVDLLYKPLNPNIVRSKVSVFIELDQQKKLLEKQVIELDKLKKEADKANKAKAQFLANMSHEIRTPIGTIMGFADLLKLQWPSEEEGRIYSDLIVKSSQELMKIVDDVLDLSKIEAGKITLEKIPFSLKELLFDFHAATLFKAKNKNIDFRININENVPDSIISDPTKIRQILNNVVGNAIKFTKKGEVKIEIGFKKGELFITVSDTGCGISQEQVKNLFQPFSQADISTSRKYGGTGLGLVLTRTLAEVLDGKFELISSVPNKGSVFQVRFNVIPVDSSNIQEANVFALTEKIRKASLKVLLVEDLEENQILISKILTSLDISVDIASTGKKGIEMAMSDDYDIILMDIQMPEMDGFETLARLKKEGYNKPIFALSAHVLKHQVSECLDRGFTDFISKPLTIPKLADALSISNFIS